MDFPKIEFVFFDLGNVIIDFDHHRCCQNIAELTNIDLEVIHDSLFVSGLQNDYELGKLNDEEFADCLNKKIGTSLSTSQICHAISDIFWVNRSIVPLISQLHASGCPIGILSNTCNAHWQYIMQRWPVLKQYFPSDQCVLSYEVNSKKPSPEIYHQAIESAGVSPNQILFIDDLSQNVAGASAAGISAQLFKSTNELIKCLITRTVRFNL